MNLKEYTIYICPDPCGYHIAVDGGYERDKQIELAAFIDTLHETILPDSVKHLQTLRVWFPSPPEDSAVIEQPKINGYFKQGFQAKSDHRPFTSNPHERNTSYWIEWNRGWRFNQELLYGLTEICSKGWHW